MMHKLHRRAFCVAMGLIGLGAGSIEVRAEDAAIRLGIVSPMSGPNARYGSFSLRGAQLAAEEINDAGGVDGRKIAIISGDSQGTPVEGVSATRRLIDRDKVDFVIGDVSSSVTLAMQPVAEDAGVLLLNAASSNPKITYGAGVGGFKWTFRNYPTDENRALIVAQYAAEKKGFTKFAVLSVDSDYGRAAIEFTKKYLAAVQGPDPDEDYYKEGEVDFRSVLAKIRDSGAQAIIMYGIADTTPIVARQMIGSRSGRQDAADRKRRIQYRKDHQGGAESARRRGRGCRLAAGMGLSQEQGLRREVHGANIARRPTTTPTSIGKRCIFWPRPSKRPTVSIAPRFATRCPRSSTTARSVR